MGATKLCITMVSVKDEFFDDATLDQVSLSDLNFSKSNRNTDDPEEWAYVRSRTGTRDTLLYSEGVYKVLNVTSDDPIEDDVSEERILDQMPLKMKRNQVVPSLAGDYATLKEVTTHEADDGTVTLRTIGRVKYVPIEYVLEVLTYDDAVSEADS